jgi:putative ABC transport system permease protein
VLGERLRLGGDDEPWRRIVGVVGDVRQTGLVDPVVAEVYLPYAQNPVSWHTGATLVVRQPVERQPGGAGVLAAVTDRLRRLDPAVPLARPQSLGEVLRDEVAAQRLQLALLGAFAAAALLLATIGLHGMARVFVAARTRELGVRQALGAGRRQVVALVLAEGARVSLPAVVVGAALALPAGRLSTSPPGLGGGPLLVLLAALAVTLVALAAVGWQARRASRVSPLAALHGEGE